MTVLRGKTVYMYYVLLRKKIHQCITIMWGKDAGMHLASYLHLAMHHYVGKRCGNASSKLPMHHYVLRGEICTITSTNAPLCATV